VNRRALEAAVLLVSGVGIAYEVALMRVFAIGQWHHFAHMIISIAMLGFGASGAFLALGRARLRGHEAALLRAAAFLLTASLVACYELSQRVPFETYELAVDARQFGWLLVLYLVLTLPFFLVAACTTLAFFLAPRHIGRLYGFAMVGSGLGAAAVTFLLYAAHVSALPYVLALGAALAHLLLMRGTAWGRIRGYGLMAVAVGLLLAGRYAPVRVSQYKGLSYARQWPDATVVCERSGPLALVTAIRSALQRETPGQIGNYPMSRYGPLPAQVGLYFDAGAVSAINAFDGHDLAPFTFLDHVTAAAAYRVVDRPRVLVMGAGGGTEVLSALWHEATHVTALEMDRNVVAIMNGELRDFSGGLYARPDVSVVTAEARGFLEAHPEARFDLIHVPLFGAFTAAAAGVHALNESYLYTVESLRLCLERLSDQGVVCLSCWLKAPPRDAIKLFATAVAACERAGMARPNDHLAFVRSWNNASILMARSPLTPAQIEAIRAFCRSRAFDVAYLPDIDPSEVNQFTILERPAYYEAAQALCSPGREAFLEAYVFHVRPATDDCPYFFRFFRWASLGALWRGMGTQWVPFVEWGYLALVATLLQAAVASAVLILLPLVVLARPVEERGVKRWVVLYFAALGAAYMFLEIAFIQKLMLFLAFPVYAVAVVLTSFLVFSGLGSMVSGRRGGRPVRRVAWAVGAIILLAGLYLPLLPRVFAVGAGWPDAVKAAASIAIIAPMAFCMGIPFPTGLQRLSDRHDALVPWAWGINGCASVVGASAATLTGVHLGFRAVVLLALVAYLVAACALARLCAQDARR